jgi:hypothetical protein
LADQSSGTRPVSESASRWARYAIARLAAARFVRQPHHSSESHQSAACDQAADIAGGKAVFYSAANQPTHQSASVETLDASVVNFHADIPERGTIRISAQTSHTTVFIAINPQAGDFKLVSIKSSAKWVSFGSDWLPALAVVVTGIAG